MAAALPEPPDLGAWEAAARLASPGWGVGHAGDGRRRPGRPAPETCSSLACDSDVGQGHREAPVSHMAFVPRGPLLCLPADTHLLMHESVPTVEEKPPRAWGETFLRPSAQTHGLPETTGHSRGDTSRARPRALPWRTRTRVTMTLGVSCKSHRGTTVSALKNRRVYVRLA